MSVSRNPKFPILDLSGFPVHLTARKDEMLDIGCCEGLLSDGRPFYARLWSENGTSFLSLFFSADGLSGADADMKHQHVCLWHEADHSVDQRRGQLLARSGPRSIPGTITPIHFMPVRFFHKTKLLQYRR